MGKLEFDRPTHTLRVLVYSLYILAFLLLADVVRKVGVEILDAMPQIEGSSRPIGFDARSIALSLGICLIPVLVARGIGHGSHDMWLLLLVLALLFTPAVRHHCAK